MTDDVIRLAIWSGPRNISTAMMRSWENRPDSVVVDEPFYAYYLAETGSEHPMAETVIAAGETDGDRVIEQLLGPVDAPLFYQKQMSHHLLPSLDRSWIPRLRNALLIRDPTEVVSSYVDRRGSDSTVVPEDVGLPQQTVLYDELSAAGDPPPVIDAGDFLRNPAGYLRALCDWIGVEFTDRMLRWPPGPRDSDGIWAPAWYANVWNSTGFEPYRAREPELGPAAERVAEACRPHYERLYALRLTL